MSVLRFHCRNVHWTQSEKIFWVAILSWLTFTQIRWTFCSVLDQELAWLYTKAEALTTKNIRFWIWCISLKALSWPISAGMTRSKSGICLGEMVFHFIPGTFHPIDPPQLQFDVFSPDLNSWNRNGHMVFLHSGVWTGFLGHQKDLILTGLK